MLADPVSTSEIQRMKQGYELLHTRLATFAHNSVTINESDTLSLSKARTDGISEGISKGISLTQSKTNSKGRYFGGSASAGVSFVVSANVGFNAGVNSSTANTSCSVFPRSRPLVINAFVSFMMVMLSAVKVTAIMNSIGTQSIQP